MKEIVNLPEITKPKGKITLELIDSETGEVVEKVEKNNFISKGTEWVYAHKMKELFQSGMHTHGTGTATSVNHLFETMLLTDADHKEDKENEWLVKGNIVGEANTRRNTVLPGDKGGLLVVDESFVREDHVRYVFNFSNSSANGTISSVYFKPAELLLSSYNHSLFDTIKYSIGEDERIYSVSGNPCRIMCYGDYIIVIRAYASYYSSSSNVMVQLFDSNMRPLGLRRIKDTTDRNSGTASVSCCIAKGDIYLGYNYIYKSSFSEFVSKMMGSDIESPILIDEMTAVSELGSNNRGIAYDEVRDRFIVGRGSYVTSFDVYDSDFNILTSIPRSPVSFDFLIDYKDDTIFTRYKNFDMNTGVEITNTLPLAGFDRFGNMIQQHERRSGIIEDVIIIPKFGFTSRARLSTPIEKTEQHIMKVTYDFILPSILDNEEE